MWLARDSNGNWFLYAIQPKRDLTMFRPRDENFGSISIGATEIFLRNGPYPKDWQESLMEIHVGITTKEMKICPLCGKKVNKGGK